MPILRRIFNYFIWTIISLLFGLGYMYILLGPKPKPSKGLMVIFELLYNYAFFHIGAMIGAVIALLYILIDVFYLNKRLKNKANSTIIRLLVIIIIFITIGATHYFLEKVVDAI